MKYIPRARSYVETDCVPEKPPEWNYYKSSRSRERTRINIIVTTRTHTQRILYNVCIGR